MKVLVFLKNIDKVIGWLNDLNIIGGLEAFQIYF